MKTLSKLTNGGSIGLYIILTLILAGCSYSFPLFNSTFYIHGQRFTVSLNYRAEGLNMYIESDKDFVVNPDCLRIAFSHDNLVLHESHYRVELVPEKNNVIVKDERILSKMSPCVINSGSNKQYLRSLFYIIGDVDIHDNQHPLYMNVLPCDYVICQGERVIKDTLKIKITQENMHWLKRPLYKPVTKTKNAKAMARAVDWDLTISP